MAPKKRSRIDGTKLLGSKRLTLRNIELVMNSLPEDMRMCISIDEFRYALRAAKDVHVCLCVIADGIPLHSPNLPAWMCHDRFLIYRHLLFRP